MDTLHKIIRRHELRQLFGTAQHTVESLSVLYARRCTLTLLHLLKDQLRAESNTPHSSPYHSRQQTPITSPHLSPLVGAAPPSPLRSLVSSSPISINRSLAVPSPTHTFTLSPAHPPFIRRQVSHHHSLSSFGPASFLPQFIARSYAHRHISSTFHHKPLFITMDHGQSSPHHQTVKVSA